MIIKAFRRAARETGADLAPEYDFRLGGSLRPSRYRKRPKNAALIDAARTKGI